MDQPELIALVRPLVERGLAYFSAWGNRCEKVHDAVDQCFDERKPDAGVAEYMLMTTWHSDEPLREAVWSFKTLDIPSESPVFADFDRFAVAIGNPAWAREMEGTLAALEAAKPHEE